MSTITNLQVKLYSTRTDSDTPEEPVNPVNPNDSDTPEEPVNPVNPNIPDTGGDEQQNAGGGEQNAGDPDTGLFTVLDTTNGQDAGSIDIAPIAFSIFVILIILAFGLPKIIKKFHSKNTERYDLNSKKFKNFRFLSTILASSSLLVGLISAAFGYVHPDVLIDVDAPEKVVIDAPILDTNDIAVVHSTIKIPASDEKTRLYITSTSSDLVDTKNPKYRIPSITEKGTLKDNTYGIYIGKDKPTATSEFTPIYSDDRGIYSIFSTDSSEEVVVDIWFGVRSRSNVDSTYETNLKVEAISTSLFSIQEMSTELCASFEQGVYDLYEMYDTRDGKIYGVARYPDGNCWMTENLDLDLDPSTTLTSANTNLPDGKTYTPNIATSKEVGEWKYVDAFSEENIARFKNYIELLYKLRSEKCNDKNAKWCKEEDEDGYSEWINKQGVIISVTSGTNNHLWKEDIAREDWDYLTEEDYSDLRQIFLDYFGVSELTEKEIKEHEKITELLDSSASTVLKNRWNEFWHGNCDAIEGDDIYDDEQYQSWCREEKENMTYIVWGEAFEEGAYKDFPQYSFDAQNPDGNYYNFLSATAGTGEIKTKTIKHEDEHGYIYEREITYIDASGSICPKNWHLATKKELKGIYKVNGIDSIDESTSSTTYAGVLSDKQFLTNGGAYIGFSGPTAFGSLPYGVYHEAEIYDMNLTNINTFAKEAMYAEIDSVSNLGYLANDSLQESLHGFSVRCVADSQFLLKFDGNSDSTIENLPEALKENKTEENEETGVTFTIPENIPTRADGARFLGWATSETHAANFIIDYAPGDKVDVDSITTIYAVWLVDEPFASPKAIHTENGYLTFVYDKTHYIEGDTFETRNGEESEIVKLYVQPEGKNFGDYETIESLDELNNIEDLIEELDDTSAETTAINNYKRISPKWSPIQDANNSSDALTNTMAKYSQVDIRGSFNGFTPDDTQLWFAFMWVSDISGLRALNTERDTNAIGMFSWTWKFNHETMAIDDKDGFDIDTRTWDTSKLEHADFMFGGWALNGPFKFRGLENWDVSNLKTASNMFRYASIPKGKEFKLDLSKWRTSSLTDMSGMFGYSDLYGDQDEGIIKFSGLSNWDVSNVTNMKESFTGAYLAQDSLDFSKWNVHNVTDMSKMFSNLHPERIKVKGIDYYKRVQTFYPCGSDYCAGYGEYFKDHGNYKTIASDSRIIRAEADSVFVKTEESEGIEVFDIEEEWHKENDHFIKGVIYETTTLNLYGWDTSNVTSMLGMFGFYRTDVLTGYGSNVDEIYLNCNKNTCDGNSWNIGNITDMRSMFRRGQYKTIYASKDWSNTTANTERIFYDSKNLIGGNGTSNNYGNYRSIAYARPDSGPESETPGLFTDPRLNITSNNSINPAPISGNSINPSYSPSYSPSIVEPTEPTSEPTTSTPKTTPSTTNPQDGNTEPYGVIRKAKATDKTDYALIIVTIISIALVFLGALIIFLIEKRDKDEDDDVEEY